MGADLRIKIRHLRAFDAVARSGSFAAAAATLHLSAPAVSLSIRELEEAVGFRLLERTTRTMRLTDSGANYLSQVQRVLAELDGAQRLAADLQRGRSVVRLATTQAILTCLLPPALSQIHARWPELHVLPLDVATRDIVDALRSRQADMAIGVDLPDDAAFDARLIYSSWWHAYLAPSHPVASRGRLGWRLLSGQRLYLTRTSRQKLERHLGPPVVFADVVETSTANSGLAMASTGQGIAIFPGYAKPLAEVMGLLAKPVQGPEVLHELQVAVPRQVPLPSPLLALRDLLVSVIEPLSVARR
jgi:DNA-binding transcriptional LysR family regulator